MNTIQTEKFNRDELLVDSELFHNRVDIVKELSAVAAQENCDDHEYDLLYQASLYIAYLRSEVAELDHKLWLSNYQSEDGL